MFLPSSRHAWEASAEADDAHQLQSWQPAACVASPPLHSSRIDEHRGSRTVGHSNILEEWSDLKSDLRDGIREELQAGILQLRHDLADAVNHIVAEMKGNLGAESSRIQETLEDIVSSRRAADALQDSAVSSKPLMDAVESCRAIGCQILEAVDCMNSNIRSTVGRVSHRTLDETVALARMQQVDQRLASLENVIAESDQFTAEAMSLSKTAVSEVMERITDSHASLLAAIDTSSNSSDIAVKTTKTELNTYLLEILDVMRDLDIKPDISSLHASLENRCSSIIEVVRAGRMDESKTLQMQSSIEQNHCEILRTLREGMADIGMAVTSVRNGMDTNYQSFATAVQQANCDSSAISEAIQSMESRLVGLEDLISVSEKRAGDNLPLLEAIHGNQDKMVALHGAALDSVELHDAIGHKYDSLLSAIEGLDHAPVLEVIQSLVGKVALLNESHQDLISAMPRVDDSPMLQVLIKLTSLQQDLNSKLGVLVGSLEMSKLATLAEDLEERHANLIDKLENHKLASLHEDVDRRLGDFANAFENYKLSSQKDLDRRHRDLIGILESSKVGNFAGLKTMVGLEELLMPLQLASDSNHRSFSSAVHGWKVDHAIMLEEVRAVQAQISPLHGDINRIKRLLSTIEQSNADHWMAKHWPTLVEDIHSSIQVAMAPFNDAVKEAQTCLFEASPRKEEHPLVLDAVGAMEVKLATLQEAIEFTSREVITVVRDSKDSLSDAETKDLRLFAEADRSPLNSTPALNGSICDLTPIMDALHSSEQRLLPLIRDIDHKQSQELQVLSSVETVLSSRIEELVDKSQGYLASLIQETNAKFTPLQNAIEKCRVDLIFAVDRAALKQCPSPAEKIGSDFDSLQESLNLILQNVLALREASKLEVGFDHGVSDRVCANSRNMNEVLSDINHNIQRLLGSQCARADANSSVRVEVDRGFQESLDHILRCVLSLKEDSNLKAEANHSSLLETICTGNTNLSNSLNDIHHRVQALMESRGSLELGQRNALTVMDRAQAELCVDHSVALEVILADQKDLKELLHVVNQKIMSMMQSSEADAGGDQSTVLEAISIDHKKLYETVQEVNRGIILLNANLKPGDWADLLEAQTALTGDSQQLQHGFNQVQERITQWTEMIRECYASMNDRPDVQPAAFSETIASMSSQLALRQEAVSSSQQIELASILDNHQHVTVEHLDNMGRGLTALLGSMKEQLLEAFHETCPGSNGPAAQPALSVDAMESLSSQLALKQEAVGNSQQIELATILEDHQHVTVEHVDDMARSLTAVLGSMQEHILQAVNETRPGSKASESPPFLAEGAKDSLQEGAAQQAIPFLVDQAVKILSVLEGFKMESTRGTQDLTDMKTQMQSVVQVVTNNGYLLQSLKDGLLESLKDAAKDDLKAAPAASLSTQSNPSKESRSPARTEGSGRRGLARAKTIDLVGMRNAPSDDRRRRTMDLTNADASDSGSSAGASVF